MKRISALLLLIAICAGITACGVYRIDKDLRIAVFDNLTKIRREDELPLDADTELTASLAANESEGMQFVLNSANSDFKVKNVTVSDLKNTEGEGTIPASDITVYRQHYFFIDVHYVTYDGDDGYYPDTLIEQKYDLSHYDNGLPVNKGENQGYWLTVTTQSDTPSGIYTGTVEVQTSIKTVTIPVTCTVWGFAIPEEVHFKNAYALRGLDDYDGQKVQYYNFLKQYRLTGFYPPMDEDDQTKSKDPEDYLAVMSEMNDPTVTCTFMMLNGQRENQYYWQCSQCGYVADNTKTLEVGYTCPECNAERDLFQGYRCRICQTMYTGYDEPSADYVCPGCGNKNGVYICDNCRTIYTHIPEGGVCTNNNDPNSPGNSCTCTDFNENLYARTKRHNFFDSFKENLNAVYENFDGPIYAYTADEPRYQNGVYWADEIKGFTDDCNRELPQLTTFVTYDRALPVKGSSDAEKMRYTPGAWAIKPAYYVEGDVEDLHEHDTELWFYTCNWPTYPCMTSHIDAYSQGMRLLTWMEYDLDIDGYTHYSATSNKRSTNDTHTDDNPWINPYAYLKGSDPKNTAGSDAAGDSYIVMIGKEGDGIIDENVPVPTIRLEVQRDSMEDYEYLWLAEQKINNIAKKLDIDIDADEVLQMFYNALYKNTNEYTYDTEKIAYVRRMLAEFIQSDNDFIAYAVQEADTAEITVITDGKQTVKVDGARATGKNGIYNITVPVSEISWTNEYTVTVGDKTATVFVMPDKVDLNDTVIDVSEKYDTISTYKRQKCTVTLDGEDIVAELTSDKYYLCLPVKASDINADNASRYTHLRITLSTEDGSEIPALNISCMDGRTEPIIKTEATESGKVMDIYLTSDFLRVLSSKNLVQLKIALQTKQNINLKVSDIRFINKEIQDPSILESAGLTKGS